MDNYKIICVDDDADVLEALCESISTLGFEVCTFVDVHEAVAFISKNEKEIVYIFSDYQMNEIDGFQFRRMVQEKSADIPFSIVTAFYTKEMAVVGMDLGVLSFIQKPFGEDEIFDSVKVHLDKRINSLREEKEMVVSFIEESYPMLEEIEELILSLEDDPLDMGPLNTFFRLLHTIKGTASCVGLFSLPIFAHRFEDFVGELKNGSKKINIHSFGVLLSALDVLKKMFASIKSGECFEFDIENDLNIFLDKEEEASATCSDASTSVENKSKFDTKKTEEEKISVAVNTLDYFIELSGELTVLRNMVVKSANSLEQKYRGDRDVDVLTEMLGEMHKVSSKLQYSISEMRKLTLEKIFRPMKRIIRDAAKGLNKKIDFEVKGEELRVDTLVGKVLSNSLVHLIRNGVDHGLETPDVRSARGKNPIGKLSLKCTEDVENIIVEIEDDGNGIDPERLKKKALENNLYTSTELNKMNAGQLFSLIFESGFSTASQVTDLSGRGVGMDMVRNCIESIGGKILIDSVLGNGTKFVLILPKPRSVQIIKSLLISVGGASFCLPLDDVGEVVSSCGNEKMRNDVCKISGKSFLRHQGKLIPLIFLSEFLTFSQQGNPPTDYSIVLVKTNGTEFGILVDEIFDIEEIVVKKLSKKLNKSGVYSGSSLVGDGHLALVIDLQGLAKMGKFEVKKRDENIDYFEKRNKEEIYKNEFLEFALFGDGKYCVPLDFVYRLEEISTKEVQFSGNLPLLHLRGEFISLISPENILGLSKMSSFSNLLEELEKLNLVILNVNEKKFALVVESVIDIKSVSDEIEQIFDVRNAIEGTIYVDGNTLSVLDVPFLIKNYKKFPILSMESSRAA